MVTLEQVKRGAMRYIDGEVLPHINGWQKMAVGVYSALAAQNIGKTFEQYKNHPAMKMLGVVDPERNELDLDSLYSEAVKYIGPDGMTLDLPMIGTMKFNKGDLDKLYQFIRNS